MFLSRNKKNNVYPCKPQFYYIKVGFKGVKIIKSCFRDATRRRDGEQIRTIQTPHMATHKEELQQKNCLGTALERLIEKLLGA